MKVVIAGGTGLIGRALASALHEEGHQVLVLTRGDPRHLPPGVAAVRWPARPDPAAESAAGGWWQVLDGAAAVVNLAGESLAARRWSPAQKQRILQSRVDATRAIVTALPRLQRPPSVLVNGSAVGYYGDRADGPATEADGPGSDFLAGVCAAWEAEAQRAEDLGVRVVLLRTGLVLARHGGAFPRIALPFRLFLGGPLGSGQQWWSWIHLADEVRLIRFLMDHPQARGPFNAVAPEPVTNEAFSRALARVLGRPCWLRAPAPALRLALGEMADALLLGGQRVLPERALALGYRFHYPELEAALRDVLGRAAGTP